MSITISGTLADQPTLNNAPIDPFDDVVVTDSETPGPDIATVTLSGAGATGTLGGTGVTGGGGGVYTVTGLTDAALTIDLEDAVFTPTPGATDTIVTTTLGLSVVGTTGTSTTPATADPVTSVIDTIDPVAPTITGVDHANQPTSDNATVTPFTGATIGDTNVGATDTLTVTLTDAGAGGTLSGAGVVAGGAGVYTVTGDAATVTTELDAALFTPTGPPNAATVTTFALSDLSSAFVTPTTDPGPTVTDTVAAVAPTISGTHTSSTADNTPIDPFTSVVVADTNAAATDTLTIQLSDAGADGTLSGTGVSGGTGGLYTLDGTTATAITTELDAAVFTPASAPNTITPTTFTLSDTSSAFGTPATDDATVVTNTVAAVAPTISGTHTSSTADNTPIDPFTSVVVADTNAAATDTLTIQLSDAGADGTLSGTGVSGGTGGLYTLDGTTATAITTELDAAVFTPASAPNTITPTTFTLSDTSSAFGTPATDDATVVTNTVAAVAPTISGTHTSSTADNTPIDPFTSVVVADTNAAATDTLTIQLSDAGADGTLSGTGVSGGTGGLYTLDGTTATAITTELDAAVFTPASAPNTITPTTFTLSDTSSAFGTPATDDATVVTDTVAAVAPTISGTHTSSTADNTPIDPFTSVVVADTNAGATDTLTITAIGRRGGRNAFRDRRVRRDGRPLHPGRNNGDGDHDRARRCGVHARRARRTPSRPPPSR